MHEVPALWRIVARVALAFALLTSVIAAADIEMEAYLGDTIPLHGYSYLGNSVYLFLTGPGLPENGVTLTDISLRADQGHFTVVNVDENQEWTYLWKTSRIASQIDEGTYTIYVTNKPVDRSHLGNEKSYKTVSVFLKDSGVSKVSITAEHVYTLNPEELVSTPRPAPSINMTSPIPTFTPLPTTTIPETAVQTAVRTTRAGTGPWTVVFVLFCCVILVFILKPRL